MNVTADQKQQIHNIITAVKEYQNKLGVDVPFFVAGGSLFSILNDNTAFKDIDVYFYNEDDFNTLTSKIEPINIAASTNNAVTLSEFNNRLYLDDNSKIVLKDQPKLPIENKLAAAIQLYPEFSIQFLRHTFGFPYDIFNTFDFNCSKVACTSNYDIVQDRSFDKNILVDLSKIKGSVLKRYNKYTKVKGAIDVNNDQIKAMYEYLFDRKDEMFPPDYNQEDWESGLNIIKYGTKLINKNDIDIAQMIHDWFNSTYKDQDLVDIFFDCKNLQTFSIENPCNEFLLVKFMQKDHSNDLFKLKEYSKYRQEIATKYPEYFI